MADQGAEIPTQPEQKKPSIGDRVRGRLADFWKRVGPESVHQENIKTLQVMHDALGPGKAQEVFTLLETPLKAISMVNGVATTVVDVALGSIANTIYRQATRLFVVGTGLAGGFVGGVTRNEVVTAAGMVAGMAAGEVIRTTSGVAVGVGVAELGVAHKAMNIAQKVVRPAFVGTAEIVGRITRGWDTVPVEPKPVVA